MRLFTKLVYTVHVMSDTLTFSRIHSVHSSSCHVPARPCARATDDRTAKGRPRKRFRGSRMHIYYVHVSYAFVIRLYKTTLANELN